MRTNKGIFFLAIFLVLFMCLLVAGIAPASAERPSLAGLQRQIDELTDRMAQTGRGNGSYAPGIVGVSAIEHCTKVDRTSFWCEPKKAILVSLPENQQVWLKGGIRENAEDLTSTQNLEISLLKIQQGNLGSVPHTFTIEVKMKMESESWEHAFKLSPEYPVYSSFQDPNYLKNTKIQASLLTDSLVRLLLDIEDIQAVEKESIGIIASSTIVERIQGKYGDGELEVRISNEGELRADYIVAFEGVPESLDIIPAPTRSACLDIQESSVLKFKLHSPDGWEKEEYDFWIKLVSPSGKLFDEWQTFFSVDLPTSSP